MVLPLREKGDALGLPLELQPRLPPENRVIRGPLATCDVLPLMARGPRAVAFYTTGLGFIEQRRLFDSSVAELRAGSSLIYLLAKRGEGGNRQWVLSESHAARTRGAETP